LNVAVTIQEFTSPSEGIAMELALSAIGGIMALVGWIWIVVAAFKDSIGWGIGSLLCGIVALIYGAMNFATLKVPVLLYVVGLILSGAGQAMMKQ
jgi:hypothetical protein